MRSGTKVNSMDEKQIQIFDEIFGALDGALGDDEADGLQILGAVLAMPDDAFETVKGSLCDTVQSTFNSPEAKIGFAQLKYLCLKKDSAVLC